MQFNILQENIELEIDKINNILTEMYPKKMVSNDDKIPLLIRYI